MADFELTLGRVIVCAGCTPLAEPQDKPRRQRVAYVRDPFGTLVEIASPP